LDSSSSNILVALEGLLITDLKNLALVEVNKIILLLVDALRELFDDRGLYINLIQARLQKLNRTLMVVMIAFNGFLGRSQQVFQSIKLN